MAYASTTDLAQRFPSLVNKDEMQREAELDAATEWIDSFCHRTFTPETSTSVRYFAADSYYVLDLGQYEISSSDSVVIATDDGTGSYATTLASSVYQLEPVNAPLEQPNPQPFTMVRALSTTWPRAYSAGTRQERIKITAKYGWPAVPESVKRACLALVVNSFENSGGVRSESIDGYSVTYVTASGTTLAVPDTVLAWLTPYVRGWAA